MVAEIKRIDYDGSKAIIEIAGTEGDMKWMINKIYELEREIQKAISGDKNE